MSDKGEPKSFQEEFAHKNKSSWMKAMKEEMDYLQKNNTCELVKLQREESLEEQMDIQVEERWTRKLGEIQSPIGSEKFWPEERY